MLLLRLETTKAKLVNNVCCEAVFYNVCKIYNKTIDSYNSFIAIDKHNWACHIENPSMCISNTKTNQITLVYTTYNQSI